MAVFKSLTFDGINSLNYGIYVTGEAVYNAPERAVEMVTIPGRNGALAIDQGYFENIEVSYPCGCFADTQAEFAEKVSAFRNAIGSRYSYKRLTDEYNADEYRLGLYKSGLDVSAVRYGTAGQFTITFDCKPQRFLLDGDAELSPTDYSDVHTVSGDIVQIDNDGSLGVKSVLTTIEPIQSLNGYDKPWSGGNGKNKVNCADISAPSTSNTYYDVVLDSTPYVLSFDIVNAVRTILNSVTVVNIVDGNGNSHYLGDTDIKRVSDDATMASAGANINGRYYVKYTGSVSRIVFYWRSNTYGTYTSGAIRNIMVEVGTTPTAWTPYENICPISGHTECVTSVSGKNVLALPIYYRANTRVPELFFIKAGTYAISYSVTGATSWRLGMWMRDKDGNNISDSAKRPYPYFSWYENPGYWMDGGNGTLTSRTITIVEDCYVRFFFAIGDTSSSTVFSNQMLELGTTVTDYEPYNGNTYTTTLGRTVYGGSLDVVSGVLTVTDANIASYNGETLPSTWISDRDVYSSGTTPTTGAQVVYKLSSPQTYQLTAQEVELLLGQNNLWASTGSVTVKYGVYPYYNPTEFDARPLIKITGSGNVAIGSQLISVTDIPNTTTVYIDCDTMEIYTLSGGIPSGASSHVSFNGNDFPVLPSGLSKVTYTTRGVSIAPRWWRI